MIGTTFVVMASFIGLIGVVSGVIAANRHLLELEDVQCRLRKMEAGRANKTPGAPPRFPGRIPSQHPGGIHEATACSRYRRRGLHRLPPRLRPAGRRRSDSIAAPPVIGRELLHRLEKWREMRDRAA